MKKMVSVLLFIFCMSGSAAFAGDIFIYANGYKHTPEKQPPRYWVLGETKKPPPKGVHPEYAAGKPDGRLTGWAREKGTLILEFLCEPGLKNAEGPDLSIWHFGPGGTRIYVSDQKKDPTEWQLLGDLPKTPDDEGVKKAEFEFGRINNVFHVKIEKWDAGFWGKGRFIDAVAGR